MYTHTQVTDTGENWLKSTQNIKLSNSTMVFECNLKISFNVCDSNIGGIRDKMDAFISSLALSMGTHNVRGGKERENNMNDSDTVLDETSNVHTGIVKSPSATDTN